MTITFVLGGARSGKSRIAEALVAASGLAPVCIATAEAGDAEMAARIAEHRARRGAQWRTVEAPLELAAAVAAEGRAGRALLVDCLTLWLANQMAAARDIPAATAALEAALGASPARIVAVANEVGGGIVPDNALARAFRDAQGLLNQRIAALADEVILVAAGLAVPLKREGRPVHALT
jgi:adenosylcobinamide kinase/adenosylcobinamide-phosphate guanylyltransferase